MATRSGLCRLDAGWKRTDEGYLDAKVYPTRVGVFPYWDSKQNKIVMELRHPDHVFNADSLRSLVGKDFTNDHPSEMVNAKNFKALSVGTVYGDHVKADDGVHTQSRVMVKDEAMIDAIESGKNQVSCGYDCTLVNTPGTFDGQNFDRIQTNIKYNHLAGVDRGRMGPEARLRADSVSRYDAYEMMPDDDDETKDKKATKGKKKMDIENAQMIRVDSRDIPTNEAGVIVIDAKLKADAAEITKQASRADAAEKALAELQAKFDVQAQELETAKKIDVDALISGRMDLMERASKIVKHDGYAKMTDKAIKQHVVKAKFPNADLVKNDSDLYLDTMFNAAQDLGATAKTDTTSFYDKGTGGTTNQDKQINWDSDPFEVKGAA